MLLNIERNIKNIRELKNLSQEYIANRLGLSIRAYSKIETGETQLTINRLNEISEILDVSPQEIIGFDESQIFNHCRQTGNIGINHINNSSHHKVFEQYESHIDHLKGEIIFLRSQLESK